MFNTPITFLQCNLGRASHSSIEISTAIPLHNASILALQEPYNLNNSPVGFPLKFSVAAPNINPLVCTFFAPDISCTLVRKFSDQYFCVCELIWPFCQPLYLINCYLPPSLPLTPLLDKLHTIICLLPDSNILVLGDFNSHNTLWHSKKTKTRGTNQKNVIENNEYKENNTMIFDADGPIVCHLPLNLEEPSELLMKYDYKFKHLDELRSDLDTNKIKLGEIIVKRYKDRNIYYLFYKENEWDNIEYDQLYDIYDTLKDKLLENKETKINIPIIEVQFNNINWDKIRVMLKYIFKDSKIFINIFKNLIINPDQDEIQNILKEYHSNVTSGHSGIHKTCSRIREKYYWPTIKRDVERFIKHCDSCQRYKLVRKKNLQPMEITTTSKQSFSKIFLDIAGPLNDTECRNKYILTLQDDLSKYSQAYPIQDHTAETVAETFVRQFICKFGSPNVIVTDQGTEFMSELFSNVAKLFKIRKYHTTAYHPQSNGALERSHQGLLDYIKQYTNQYKDSWDNWIDFAMLSYNTTPHTVTQFIPYELVFGRKPNLPSLLTSTNEPIYTYEDYVTELKLKLSHAFDTAHKHIIDYKERN